MWCLVTNRSTGSYLRLPNPHLALFLQEYSFSCCLTIQKWYWTNDILVMIFRCGHMCCCITCSSHLTNCPLCRRRIEQVVKTFRHWCKGLHGVKTAFSLHYSFLCLHVWNLLLFGEIFPTWLHCNLVLDECLVGMFWIVNDLQPNNPVKSMWYIKIYCSYHHFSTSVTGSPFYIS